jgi:hypothetical protein
MNSDTAATSLDAVGSVLSTLGIDEAGLPP